MSAEVEVKWNLQRAMLIVTLVSAFSAIVWNTATVHGRIISTGEEIAASKNRDREQDTEIRELRKQMTNIERSLERIETHLRYLRTNSSSGTGYSPSYSPGNSSPTGNYGPQR